MSYSSSVTSDDGGGDGMSPFKLPQGGSGVFKIVAAERGDFRCPYRRTLHLVPSSRSLMKLTALWHRIFGNPAAPSVEKKRVREIPFCLPKSEVTGLRGEFLRAFLTQSKRDVFIETGTYMGRSTALAAGLFKEVHTIELSAELHAAAVERFAGHAHVTCHGGDSAAVLPAILSPLKSRTMFFWLDGHYSGGVTAQGDVVTPILGELEAIRTARLSSWIIAVDDLRIFRGSIKTSDIAFNDYPTALELASKLRDIDPAAQVGVWGDTMVACSGSLHCEFSQVTVQLLRSRLYDENDVSAASLLDPAIESEDHLRKVNAEVLAKFEELATSYLSSENFGLGGHYHLWTGLARLGQNRAELAVESFRRAMTLDVRHWRVVCYLAEALHLAGQAEEAAKELSRVQVSHSLVERTRARIG